MRVNGKLLLHSILVECLVVDMQVPAPVRLSHKHYQQRIKAFARLDNVCLYRLPNESFDFILMVAEVPVRPSTIRLVVVDQGI